jgi:FAD/FMN-containing dehydrogenase/Fe-S oxidoreductase
MDYTSEYLEDLFTTLQQAGFQGDKETAYAARIVAATDNSVYQVVPDGILYPRCREDINTIVRAVNQQPHKTISLTARGAGTGTNGQSLNHSLIVDTSRYLNKIIRFDASKRQVCVEPGVVLDQLNEYLKPHGLFFPANVSTASRATIGGMVATDASGKGSRIYGKTSAYIEALDLILADGSDYRVCATDLAGLEAHKHRSLGDRLQFEVYQSVLEHRQEIDRIFPDLNRGLTGYNLKQVIGEDDRFRMSYLLAGSEGTLALTGAITLNLVPLPKFKALIVVLYDDYQKALRHVAELCKSDPAAIEILDDKIISQAQRDPIWHEIQSVFSDQALDQSYRAMNFVEVVADSEESLQQQCDKFDTHIKSTADDFAVLTSLVETDAKAMASLWNLRSRSVGLLAALDGDTQGMAFVEDSTVPPQHLADYVVEFRAILDQHGIDYAMYGHADVGCLHVRPMLDMKQQSNRDMIRSITDEVAKLVSRYGGLLWGEHGRGFRGEYSPMFFGEQLMPVLHAIKTAFDPHNLFNPGKLAVPAGSSRGIDKIDEVAFRGSFDQQIESDWERRYKSAINCNGNAACFSWQVNDAMCPSYRASRDKTLSPKARAAMLREWARLKSISPNSILLPELEKEIYRSLNACLSCKSCTYSCPLKVDIPELKSSFLQQYHQGQSRKPGDMLFAEYENLAAIAGRLPQVANWITQNPISRFLLSRVFGIVSIPAFGSSLHKGLVERAVTLLDLEHLPAHSEADPQQVILLPDSFNASHCAEVLFAACDVLRKFGYKVLVAPLQPNGKALHVKGYRDRFKRLAQSQVDRMRQLTETGLPVISVEVVSRLMHEKEYPDVLGQTTDYRVWSIESWLSNELASGKLKLSAVVTAITDADHLLLPHCMEQTGDQASSGHWQLLFDEMGIPLATKAAGCCGMAGLFGHERENQRLSNDIFNLNWQQITAQAADRVLATGFSCRCQLQRHGKVAEHPLVVLNSLI